MPNNNPSDEPAMGYQQPSSYNFNENMQDPFGSKKPTVMNTPPKSDPFASMPQPTGKANFHDELADQSRAQVEQPEAGA